MGFRCPGCNTDFGLNEQDLKNHLREDCGEGNAVASITIEMVRRLSGKKKTKDRKESKPKEPYTHVSEDHDFRKLNIVTTKDMVDLMQCRNCGVKCKRKWSSYIFDRRISNKRIENCDPPPKH